MHADGGSLDSFEKVSGRNGGYITCSARALVLGSRVNHPRTPPPCGHRLRIGHFEGRAHLPVVEIVERRRAA
jgi:hypothetical protein